MAVPDPWGRELQDYRVGLGDATGALIPTHVTLLPPTEMDPAGMPALVAHLDAVARRTPPFSIRLHGTATFRPVSQVVFVTVAEGSGACEELSAAVRGGPFPVELTFPYHPHVTVAHDLDEVVLDRAQAELAGFECEFQVTGFGLYGHHGAAGWRTERSFPLGGPEAQG